MNQNMMTKREEECVIYKGRIKLMVFLSTIVMIFLLFFEIKIEFFSIWYIRRRENRTSINAPYVCLTIGIVLLIYMLFEPYWFKIQKYYFVFKKNTNDSITNMKLVHLTDTHVDYSNLILNTRRLRKLVTLINKENPDYIIFTGDMISRETFNTNKDLGIFCGFIKELKAPVIAVLGNHDLCIEDEIVDKLIASNVEVLRQKTIELQFKDTSFYITGLYPYLSEDYFPVAIQEVLSDFNGDSSKLHILLAHAPDIGDEASISGVFDIQFSGHSHGGQVLLPFNAGALHFPIGCKKYNAQVTCNYKIRNMILSVSRGLGISSFPYPPVRFLCRPEFSVINISTSSI